MAILILPSVTFAAWYNPFSWFAKTPATVIVPTESPIQSATSTLVALPVPKPVITNTITVEDPKLQSQINELAQSNTDLQVKLSTLTGQYNALVLQNASLVTTNANLSTRPVSCDVSQTQNTTSTPASNGQVIISYDHIYPANTNNGNVGAYVFKVVNNSEKTTKIDHFIARGPGDEVYALASTREEVTPITKLQKFPLDGGVGTINLENLLIMPPHDIEYIYVYTQISVSAFQGIGDVYAVNDDGTHPIILGTPAYMQSN